MLHEGRTGNTPGTYWSFTKERDFLKVAFLLEIVHVDNRGQFQPKRVIYTETHKSLWKYYLDISNIEQTWYLWLKSNLDAHFLKIRMTVDAFQFSFQTNLHNDKPLLLTGSRCSSASLLGVRGFTGTSSLHSLSDALGDSARSRNSSRFGPLNLILSNRLSMFNTEICVFILTWREAALQGQRQQIEKLCNCITYKAKSI